MEPTLALSPSPKEEEDLPEGAEDLQDPVRQAGARPFKVLNMLYMSNLLNMLNISIDWRLVHLVHCQKVKHDPQIRV